MRLNRKSVERSFSLLTLSYKLTKLRKNGQNLINHYLFKSQIFLSFKTTICFQVKKLDALIWRYLRRQLDLSLLSSDLKCSVLKLV